jgi:putative transposase
MLRMRALKTKMRSLDKSQFKRLKELTHTAKNLYNQTLWTLREAYEMTRQYFSYPQMKLQNGIQIMLIPMVHTTF